MIAVIFEARIAPNKQEPFKSSHKFFYRLLKIIIICEPYKRKYNHE
ncbi:hypothetical protein EC835_103201 [Providencia alcalifaciens]|uniref:Uncharacterized protein n=1 Tax=Providencia alcalifaciens TaxID=126385 RepID=A0A4R3NMJ2_9GAMM|nr:hypothetical protein EC835_103201 [Providencia alcalifaciens]